MSTPPVGKKAIKAAEKEVIRAEKKAAPAGGVLHTVKSAVKEVGARLAHEFHPMLGAAADVLLGKQHLMDEAPTRLSKILGGRHASLRGRHKMAVPMSMVGGDAEPEDPEEMDEESPAQTGRDAGDEDTAVFGNAVGVVNKNMVWQEVRHYAATEDAEESVLLVGSTAGPSLVTNGAANPVVNFNSAAGLADCSARAIPYSPDTFNGRTAATGNYYSRWNALWWRVIYYPAVATTTPGAFATGGLLDGSEAGVPSPFTFPQVLQMTPSSAGPFFEKRVLIEMMFKKTDQPLFTESDSATLAGQRQTRAAELLMAPNADFPSGTTPNWANVTLGYTKIEYALVLFGPSLAFGISLTLRVPDAVVRALKRAIATAPFEVRAELLKANPRQLWIVQSLAEYEAVVESLNTPRTVTCPEWVVAPTSAAVAAAAGATARAQGRSGNSRPPSVTGK